MSNQWQHDYQSRHEYHYEQQSPEQKIQVLSLAHISRATLSLHRHPVGSTAMSTRDVKMHCRNLVPIPSIVRTSLILQVHVLSTSNVANTQSISRSRMLATVSFRKLNSGLSSLWARTARGKGSEEPWSTSVSGSPAVLGQARRPVALRPCLSTGLPFSAQCCLYQLTDFK